MLLNYNDIKQKQLTLASVLGFLKTFFSAFQILAFCNILELDMPYQMVIKVHETVL